MRLLTTLQDGLGAVTLELQNNISLITVVSWIAGGKEAGISSILPSLDKMNIHEGPESGAKENLSVQQKSSIFPTGSHDQFSPGPTPPIPISTTQENPQPNPEIENPPEYPSNQSSYKEKISSATSAIADKAISAKNVAASKLGYGQKENPEEHGTKEHEMQEAQDTVKPSPVENGKRIAATVTEKLTPVYGKAADAGRTVISKVRGAGSGTTTTTDNTSTGNEAEIKAKGQDKMVSVKDYFTEKLKPGEEDRALSEVISEALHKRKAEPEKADRPAMGKVTESEEVKRQLGSMEETEKTDPNSAYVPGKSVVEKLKGAVGSVFGKGEEPQACEQSLGSSIGTEGFTSTTASGAETGERRLQESGN